MDKNIDFVEKLYYWNLFKSGKNETLYNPLHEIEGKL